MRPSTYLAWLPATRPDLVEVGVEFGFADGFREPCGSFCLRVASIHCDPSSEIPAT